MKRTATGIREIDELEDVEEMYRQREEVLKKHCIGPEHHHTLKQIVQAVNALYDDIENSQCEVSPIKDMQRLYELREKHPIVGYGAATMFQWIVAGLAPRWRVLTALMQGTDPNQTDTQTVTKLGDQ
jgi:hypothetical protein